MTLGDTSFSLRFNSGDSFGASFRTAADSFDIFGSNGSQTSDYNLISNKPSIEGVTLVGDKTLHDFGMNVASYNAIANLFK